MDFLQIPLFSTMKGKLDYMSQRQSVLAQNIANADTPNYRAKDVSSPDFKEMVKKSSGSIGGPLPMTLTNDKHVTHKTGGGQFKVENRKLTDELNPNGNNVAIEEEMMKVGQNQAEYQKVLSLYGKTISMFKTALGRPSGG